jgi:hypothetical protein
MNSLFDSAASRLRMMTAVLALATGLTGCDSSAYDVTEGISYDAAIRYDEVHTRQRSPIQDRSHSCRFTGYASRRSPRDHARAS